MQPSTQSQEESQSNDTGLFLNVGEKGYQEERWAMNRLAELGRIVERDLELGLCQEEESQSNDTGLFLNVGEKGYQEERWAMNRLAELGRIVERDLELGLCQEEEESNAFSKSVMPIPVLIRQTTGMVLCNGSMVYNGNPTGERLMLNSCIDFVIDDIDDTLDTEE